MCKYQHESKCIFLIIILIETFARCVGRVHFVIFMVKMTGAIMACNDVVYRKGADEIKRRKNSLRRGIVHFL